MRRQHAYWVQAEQSGRHLPTDPEEHAWLPKYSSRAPSRPLQDLIGIAENVTDDADPAGLMRALARASMATLRNPAGVVAANARCGMGVRRCAAGDGRALDRSGPESALWRYPAATSASPIPRSATIRCTSCWRRSTCCSASSCSELLDIAGLDAGQESKARFAAKFLVDALAPTNTLPGNPAALQQGLRDRRQERAVRAAKHGTRHPPQRRVAVAGRRERASRSASTWPRRRARWSIAAT